MSRNIELLQQDEDDDDNDEVSSMTDDEEMSLLNDKERFLVEKLRIPVEWIHEAKVNYDDSVNCVKPERDY